MASTRTHHRSPWAVIKAAAAPALALVVIVNFAGYALLGSNGLLAWGDYKRQLARRSTELASLQAQRAVLQHRNALLDPRKVDPDLAEELVKKNLGVVRPDEVVVDLH